MEKENLEQLTKQYKKISDKIYKIKAEKESEREKQMEGLVGCCVKGEYYDFAYRKILDFVYNKDYGIHFIMEEVKINDGGEASITTTSDYPYVNIEWAREKIPMSGWTEEITNDDYQVYKKQVLGEMLSRKKLKKFLLKRN